VTNEQRMVNLFEALADHAESMTDEELIAECVEDGEDPHEVAERTRRLLFDTIERHEAKTAPGEHSNTCDLVGFRQGYNAPAVCSCGAAKRAKESP
jgi:hypothetical protein